MQNQILEIQIPNEVTGYKIATLDSWVGTCIIIPRTELRSVQNRPEVSSAGIYFLFGENDESGNEQLYIGEGEKVIERLFAHDAKKVFWNTAIIFTGGLDKAKAKLLEHFSVSEALKVGRYKLENIVAPGENVLSENGHISTQNYFLRIKFILTALGYPIFDYIKESVSDKRLYNLKGEGFDARAQVLTDAGMLVLKDSIVRKRETDSFGGSAFSMRNDFLVQKILIDHNNESYIFTKDVLFKSPSAAAATIAGRSINGWTAWKDENGNTLDKNARE